MKGIWINAAEIKSEKDCHCYTEQFDLLSYGNFTCNASANIDTLKVVQAR